MLYTQQGDTEYRGVLYKRDKKYGWVIGGIKKTGDEGETEQIIVEEVSCAVSLR